MIAATTFQNNLPRLQIALSLPGNTQGRKQPRGDGMNYLGSDNLSEFRRKQRRSYLWGSREQCSVRAGTPPLRRGDDGSHL